MIPATAQALAAYLAALVLVGDDTLAADEFSAYYQLDLGPVSGT